MCIFFQSVGHQISGLQYTGRCTQGIRTLLNTFSLDNLEEGVKKDIQVVPEGQVALVAQVITYPLTEGEVVAPANLGQPRDARRRDILFFRVEGVKMAI